jgi:hypothetical protein
MMKVTSSIYIVDAKGEEDPEEVLWGEGLYPAWGIKADAG